MPVCGAQSFNRGKSVYAYVALPQRTAADAYICHQHTSLLNAYGNKPHADKSAPQAPLYGTSRHNVVCGSEFNHYVNSERPTAHGTGRSAKF